MWSDTETNIPNFSKVIILPYGKTGNKTVKYREFLTESYNLLCKTNITNSTGKNKTLYNIMTLIGWTLSATMSCKKSSNSCFSVKTARERSYKKKNPSGKGLF